MAIQQVNVYSFDVQLYSQQTSTYHVGTKAIGIGATAADAQAVIEEQFGTDLAMIRGGVLLNGWPAYTTLEDASS